MTQDQEQVLRFLSAGDIARRVDGRIDDGFLPTAVLEWAIKQGYAESFDNKGMQFVRITSLGDTTIKRELAFRLHRTLK